MWNSLFTECLACGVALPEDASNLHCENHQHLAKRAMARLAWGAGIIPRLIILLLVIGILFATSL